MKNSSASEDHMKPDFLKGDMNSEFFHEVVNVEKERTISHFSRKVKIKLRGHLNPFILEELKFT